MRQSSFNFAAMMLTLATGIGLGTVFSRTPQTSDAAGRPEAPAAPAPLSDVVPAQDKAPDAGSEREADATRYVAVIFARQSADIVARSEGRLEEVYVNLGDRLKPGDVIARNESRSLAQQLRMAEALLRSVEVEQRNREAELKNTRSRYQRREELWESGLISTEDLATARGQVESAEGALEIAKARVAEQSARIEDAKESLGNTVVTAVFGGTVAARYLDPGATVSSGTPIISLIRSDDLWVRFAVPEMQQAAMGIGSPIKFQAEGLAVTVPGVVQYVSPSLTSMSQEVFAEAKLKVPASLLEQIKPGASGLVSPVR